MTEEIVSAGNIRSGNTREYLARVSENSALNACGIDYAVECIIFHLIKKFKHEKLHDIQSKEV